MKLLKYVTKKKGLLSHADHWDPRKINVLVAKHKPEFLKCGVQVHFNQYSYWRRQYHKYGYFFVPGVVRWVAFADATVDPKLCTQYLFDPTKIYDPPGPKEPEKKCHPFYHFNKDNMKLVEAGNTHFPKDHATYLLYGASASAPALPVATAVSAPAVATAVEVTAASTADPADVKL